MIESIDLLYGCIRPVHNKTRIHWDVDIDFSRINTKDPVLRCWDNTTTALCNHHQTNTSAFVLGIVPVPYRTGLTSVHRTISFTIAGYSYILASLFTIRYSCFDGLVRFREDLHTYTAHINWNPECISHYLINRTLRPGISPCSIEGRQMTVTNFLLLLLLLLLLRLLLLLLLLLLLFQRSRSLYLT